jgi:hypothetical protein
LPGGSRGLGDVYKRQPLTKADQRLPEYVYEKSCPYCINGKPKGRGNTAQSGC